MVAVCKHPPDVTTPKTRRALKGRKKAGSRQRWESSAGIADKAWSHQRRQRDSLNSTACRAFLTENLRLSVGKRSARTSSSSSLRVFCCAESIHESIERGLSATSRRTPRLHQPSGLFFRRRKKSCRSSSVTSFGKTP